MRGKEGRLSGERKWRVLGTALVAAGALALSGCGSDEGEQRATQTAQVLAPDETQPRNNTQTSSEAPVLVFDDLAGGSSVIEVYPGVKDTKRDKKRNGTFMSGQPAVAECKTEGRTVQSAPGEENRTYSEWIRIQGTPGEAQYATAVYVENPDVLLEQLPVCDEVTVK